MHLSSSDSTGNHSLLLEDIQFEERTNLMYVVIPEIAVQD